MTNPNHEPAGTSKGGEFAKKSGGTTSNKEVNSVIRIKAGIVSREELAKQYVAIHNQASEEFRAVFKEVNAKMWNNDDAHIIQSGSAEFIEQQMKDMSSEYIGKVYGRAVVRPLTVLDSYPNVTKSQRDSLNKKVDKIVSKYNSMYRRLLSKVK